MQTIKTAVVVVLLLGVCYGAYVALNAPEPTLPETLQDWNEDAMALNVENGAAVDIPQLSQTPAPDALDSLAPPAVTPPAPVGPTPPSLTLPGNPPSLSGGPTSSSGKSPDILTPPAPLAGKPGSNMKQGLGNDVPGLPDLALPSSKEGDSVPLPGLPEPSLPSTPASFASTPSASGSSDPGFPPAPSLAGLDKPADDLPPAGDLGTTPGLLGNSENSGVTLGSNALGGAQASNSKSPAKTAQPFAVAREQTLKLANEGKLREALAMMSPYFNHIELTHDEHVDLVNLLDALAGEVIYSRRHLLENKFIVSTGDTLESIANKYRISPEILAKVNGMGDSRVVLAGTELKVFNGPFRAEVAVARGELTLFLGELYAGRFSVGVGNEPVPTEGSYTIVERRRDRSYVGPDSKFIAANDARNPYGGYWMHLGNNLCIHGSPEADIAPPNVTVGCIGLAPLDAKEVYTLLTQGSEVVIKR